MDYIQNFLVFYFGGMLFQGILMKLFCGNHCPARCHQPYKYMDWDIVRGGREDVEKTHIPDGYGFCCFVSSLFWPILLPFFMVTQSTKLVPSIKELVDNKRAKETKLLEEREKFLNDSYIDFLSSKRSEKIE